MPLIRYLGAAWAAVHGPSDPRRLCIFALEQGFRGVLPAPTARPIDWVQVREAAEDLPFDLGGAMRLCALSATDDRCDRGLGSKNSGDRGAALAQVRRGVGDASRIGASTLILEPGAVPMIGETGPLDLGDPGIPWTADLARSQAARRRAGENRALDLVCRALFELARHHPEQRLALTASRMVDGLGTPAALGHIFEDLPRLRLSYWHEAAVCALRQSRLGEPQGEWLERFGSRLAGVSLGDWSEERLHAAPGSGLVDYPLLASYLDRVGARLPAVVELEPAVPPAELPSVRAFLEKFGL
ncbi:MAG: hypothetical protein U1F36_13165 [Planctomycetota bacterium]